jgi:hypothetical protein
MERAGTEVRPGRSQSLENACRWRSGEVRVIDLAWRLEGAHRSRRGHVGRKKPSERRADDSDVVQARLSAQPESRMRIAWRHPTPSVWHTHSTTSPFRPQPKQCQKPSSMYSLREGERSKWPWEGNGQRTMVDPEVRYRSTPARRATSIKVWRGAGGLDGERPHSPISIPLTGSSATGLSTCLLPSRYHWPRLSA